MSSISANTVGFPPGWDQKFDPTTHRPYYVNHQMKKTQWEDPRLSHPAIWRHPEVEKLRGLQSAYPSVAEANLRQLLVENCFDTAAVRVKLAPLAPSPKSPRGAKSPSAASNKSAKSPATFERMTSPKPVESLKPDEFGIFYLKSRFSSVPDSVIVDVLVNCENNQSAAAEKLKLMGFEDNSTPKSHKSSVSKPTDSSRPKSPQSPKVAPVREEEVEILQLRATERNETVEVKLSPTDKDKVELKVSSPPTKRFNGANPALRVGPMGLTHKSTLANGPNPNFCKGPDRSLLVGPNQILVTNQ